MKKFFYLLLALPFVLVACNNEDSEPVAKNYVLSLTSDKTLNFTAEGGEDVITYQLAEETRSAAPTKVVATCLADWAEATVVAEESKINVAVVANEGGEARETKVVVTYGAQSFDVAVKQEANGSVFAFSYFNGSYYEPGFWGEGYDQHNYYILLSNTEDTESFAANSVYLELDIWAATGDASAPVVPNGEYVFDGMESAAAGTIGCEYSMLYVVDGNGDITEAQPFNGKIVVSDNKIEGSFTDMNGEKYSFTYNGSLDLPSTAKSDVVLSGSDWGCTIENCGDYYGIGATNYLITLVEDMSTYSGNYLSLDLLVDTSATDCSGLYTALDDETDVDHKFISGYIYSSMLAGCWYAILDNGDLTSIYQPLYDGSINIVFNADGTKTITFDCVDDAGYTITGSITTLPVDEYYAGTSALSAKANKGKTILPSRSLIIR